MANMSYCRFRNTKNDLADCVNALEDIAYDGEEISDVEWENAKRMKELCEQYLEIFEEIDENNINFED